MTLTKPTRDITDMGIGLRSGGTLTIAAGVITLSEGSHDIDTEGAVALDQLNTINPGLIDDGALVLLYAADDARTVEVVSGAGNIILQAGGSVFLDDLGKSIMLRRDGANFRDIITSSVGSGYVFVEEKILSTVAQIEFTDLDFASFASFKFNFSAIMSAAGFVQIIFSQSSTFLVGATDYAYRVDGSSNTFANASAFMNFVHNTGFGGSPFNNGSVGILELFPPLGSPSQFNGASIVGQVRKYDTTSNAGQTFSGGHLRLNELPIDGIRFFTSAGVFDDVSIQLWGLRK